MGVERAKAVSDKLKQSVTVGADFLRSSVYGVPIEQSVVQEVDEEFVDL
jgi:hypothetical protein